MTKPPKWFQIWSETVYQSQPPKWFQHWSKSRFDPLVDDVKDLKSRIDNIVKLNNLHE